MKVKELFLHLTEQTTVSNYEDSVINFLQSILPNTYLDSYTNLHCEIGQSNTLFVSHLDNYCETVKKVSHKFDNEFVLTDKTTILGADNKAGVSVLVSMIAKKIPGHYVFFRAEELGCVGSLDFKKNNYKGLMKYNKCIAFDRKGYSDIVYCQNDINTASLEFSNILSNEFSKFSNIKYKATEGGVTDSGSFKYLIPECINLSVGFFANHTVLEKQNLAFLQQLANTVCKIDWENLPTFRQVPNLMEIVQMEKTANDRRLEEIKSIEAELGFSLY